MRAAVLCAAVRRRDVATHTQLIRHFPELDPTDQAVYCDIHRTMPHHAAPALRAALLEGDAALCSNACEIILAADDFDLFPTLIRAAENTQHLQASTVLGTITRLVDRLRQDLARWAAGMRAGATIHRSFASVC